MRHFMTTTTLQFDYKTLKEAYVEIKTFIEKETGDKVSSLKTKIENDLGCAGDDNVELLEKFISKYKLDSTGFNYAKHFLSEGELFGSGSVLLQIVSIPIYVLLWTLNVLTFGKVNLTKKLVIPDWNRQVTDMTFGDLLTWYLSGKYSLRTDINFQLTKAA